MSRLDEVIEDDGSKTDESEKGVVPRRPRQTRRRCRQHRQRRRDSLRGSILRIRPENMVGRERSMASQRGCLMGGRWVVSPPTQASSELSSSPIGVPSSWKAGYQIGG